MGNKGRGTNSPTADQRRRYTRLRTRFLLQLDQRTGREKAVLRKTIGALAQRLR